MHYLQDTDGILQRAFQPNSTSNNSTSMQNKHYQRNSALISVLKAVLKYGGASTYAS